MKKMILSGLGLVSIGLISTGPALAGPPHMRYAQGQAYWTGEPNIPLGPFWSTNAHFYDPNNYNGRNNRDADNGTISQTVYDDHDGAARCVFRQRVVNTNAEAQNPIIRVCRR